MYEMTIRVLSFLPINLNGFLYQLMNRFFKSYIFLFTSGASVNIPQAAISAYRVNVTMDISPIFQQLINGEYHNPYATGG